MSKASGKKQAILSRQLLTHLGVSLLIIGFATLWINYSLIKADLEQKVQQKAQSITQGLEFGTEGLIEFHQTSILRRTVQNYATLPNVVEIAIVNPDGLTVANSAHLIPHRRYRPEFSQWMEQAATKGIEINHKTSIEEQPVLVNILPFSSTIFGVSGRRGLIIVILDIHQIQQEARRILFASTITFALGIIFILVMLGLLLDRKIFRPLQTLHKSVFLSKQTKTLVIPESMPANEIGFLADALAETFQERNQIEEILMIEEEKYRNLVETSQGIIWSLDHLGTFTFVNSAVQYIYGYTPEEMVGHHFTDFYNPDQDSQAEDVNRHLDWIWSEDPTIPLDRIIAHNRSYLNFEVTHITKEGKPVHLLFNAIRIYDEKGNVIGSTGTALDISERKLAEAALERQLRRATLLEHITQKIRQSLDINTILHSAADQIGLIFEINRCQIYLYLLKPTLEIPLIAEYVEQNYASSLSIVENLADNLYIQTLIKCDQAIASTRVEQEPLLQNIASLCQELQIKSMLAVRTSYQEKPNGIIILNQCDRYRQWTTDEIELLEAVAAQVGIALAQAKLLEKEKQHRTQLNQQNQLLQQEITERQQVQQALRIENLKSELFADIALKIRQSLEIQEILQTTVNEVQKILVADRVLIYRLQEDGSGCVISEQVLPEWSAMLNTQLSAEVFPLEVQQQYEQDKVTAINCTEQVYRETNSCLFELAQRWSIKAKLVAAIWEEELLWGFIIAHQCSTPRVWTEFDKELVQQLADQVGIAINHAQILEKQKELSQLKSSFISMASHEFRTPLAVISSSAELLQHYGEKLNSEKKLKHFERIQSSIKHMTSLLEDVLMINKVEAHKIEFHPVKTDIVEFCQDLVEQLQQSKAEYQILFNTQSLDNSVQQFSSLFAQVDPKLLQQILNNLLTNAIKYSPVGSKVYFNLSHQNNCVCFQVRDEGIGIPPEDLKNLFTPFHRAGNVGNISGTGLGLSIVQKCVEVHQGTIEVESELEVGTTFRVTIPLNM